MLDKEILDFNLMNLKSTWIYICLRDTFPPAAPPTARLREEQKKVLAGPESNVTLLCLVDGHPQPNINWTV